MKKLLALLLSVVMIILMSGCGAAADNKYTTDEAVPGGGDIGVTDTTMEKIDRKLVRTYDIDAETKDFDKATSTLESAIKKAEGYIQNQSVSNNSYNDTRYMTLTARVPADKVESFLIALGDAVNVTRQSSNVEDVTDSYVDVESHIAALETEQTALMSMLEKAEKLDDVISIQSRLSEVRGELESYKARKKNYDTLVAYATVNFQLDEVERETESKPTFWSKAGNAFVDGWEFFAAALSAVAIFLIGALPFILVIGGAVVIAVVITKKSKSKKKEAKKEEQQK